MPDGETAAPVRTTCPYCGVGCGVLATPTGPLTADIAGDPAHPANHGRLCSKGSALGETLDLEGRLLHPQVAGARVDWDTALDTVARRFRQTIAEHGPESVAMYVSGQLLTEDYYAANKFMKGLVGTANIDTNSRLCMSSAVVGHQRAFGEDVVPGCYDDLDEAELVVLVGANSAWCHPIVYQRIRAAQAQRGAKVVVIDPRRSATAEEAYLHLPLAPGSDVLLFLGLLAHLERDGRLDFEHLEAHVSGFGPALGAARKAGGKLPLVARGCGLDATQLAEFYRLFARSERVVTLFSQGVNQSSAGSDKVSAIINCHLATGRINKPGAGPFSITGQPNAMGGREVGGLASTLAAHMGFDDAERVQRFWQSPHIATQPGLKAVDLFTAVGDGRIKLIWIMATNPAVSLPNNTAVRDALAACPTVIVSDCMAETDTMTLADIRLPAQAWGEKDGTVTNSERVISRQRAFLPPAGEARPDWWIVSQVAQRLDGAALFDYDSAHSVFDEHVQLSSFENTGDRIFNLVGLSELPAEAYDALAPRAWPIVDQTASPRAMPDHRCPTPDGKARMVALAPRGPAHAVDADYPLVLNTGRVRDHWHTMTRTGKAPRLGMHRAEPTVELHPDDARQLGLFEHDIAQLRSRWGKALGRVWLDSGQRRGSVFMPMHWNDAYASSSRADAVVNPAVDPDSGEPEFKHTPVSISRVPTRWYGFALSRERLNFGPGGQLAPAYWARACGDSFWRTEFASVRGDEVDWPKLARAWLGAGSEHLDYADARTRQYRGAVLDGGRLQACLFVAAGPARLPSRSWLGGLFAQDALDESDRRSLLAGAPADAASDTGPQVCACYGIGQAVIVQAIADGCTTTDALGQRLRAGTNCGSCLPDLRALLSADSPQ